MALVELKGVCKSYTKGGETIRPLDHVDLQVDTGEFVSLMGASGSGKSTLLNVISGIDPTSNFTSGFALYQNYPNPFNSTTLLPFRLPKHSSISLIIYDITGKEVIKLTYNQNYAAGEHKIAWNGTSQTGKEVSSGIYFYELRAGNFKQVKKMLLSCLEIQTNRTRSNRFRFLMMMISIPLIS